MNQGKNGRIDITSGVWAIIPEADDGAGYVRQRSDEADDKQHDAEHKHQRTLR